MTDYSKWANRDQGRLKAYLKEYNDWVFGPAHPNQIPGKVFVHGQINNSEVREGRHEINRGEPIIVHVVGTNFLIDDKDRNGNTIEKDSQVQRACQDEEGDDQVDSVKIKGPGENDWTRLEQYVSLVRSNPDNFNANSSDLNKWKPKVDPGERRGAWSSKLIVLDVPKDANIGVYEISCDGHSSDNYGQHADFKIKVK